MCRCESLALTLPLCVRIARFSITIILHLLIVSSEIVALPSEHNIIYISSCHGSRRPKGLVLVPGASVDGKYADLSISWCLGKLTANKKRVRGKYKKVGRAVAYSHQCRVQRHDAAALLDHPPVTVVPSYGVVLPCWGYEPRGIWHSSR